MQLINYQQRKQPNAHLKWKVNFLHNFLKMSRKWSIRVKNNSKISHFLLFWNFCFLFCNFHGKNHWKIPKNDKKKRSYKNLNIKNYDKVACKIFLKTFCEIRKSSKILKWPLYEGLWFLAMFKNWFWSICRFLASFTRCRAIHQFWSTLLKYPKLERNEFHWLEWIKIHRAWSDIKWKWVEFRRSSGSKSIFLFLPI